MAASRLLDAASDTTKRALKRCGTSLGGSSLARSQRADRGAAAVRRARRRPRRLDGLDSGAGREVPLDLEAVTYFCAVETVRELGGSALVELDLDDSHLILTVTAIDLRGRLTEGGRGVADRVLAWGGTVTIGAVTIEGQAAPARLRVNFPQPVVALTSLNLSGPNADFGT